MEPQKIPRGFRAVPSFDETTQVKVVRSCHTNPVATDKTEKLAAVAIMEYSVRRLENSIPFAAVSLVQSCTG